MAYTPREQALLDNCKLVIPSVFIADASDDKILAFIDLVVNDINWWLPYTNYDRKTFPDPWFQTVILGTAYFSQLFKQMEATLQDFSYNDNGLSVQVDQVGKINTAMVNMLKAYGQQIDFIKKAMLLKLGAGLGTPRFQSQIGQFLKISLGCLLEKTLVETINGLITIENIKIGDKVLSHDGEYHKVLRTLKRKANEKIVKINLEGTELILTANHPIYTIENNMKIWTPIEEIKKNTKCIAFDRNEELILNASKIEESYINGFVYNLEVEKSNSYNVEGIIVHNSSFSWGS